MMHIPQSTLTKNLHRKQQSDLTVPDQRVPLPPKTRNTPKNSNKISHQRLDAARANSAERKLTLGLKSYQEIKNVYTKCRGIDQSKNLTDRFSFTPNTNKKDNNRTFDGFIDSQTQFQEKKRQKIMRMSTQMQEKIMKENTRTPQIDKKSRKISDLLNQDEVFSRLSKEKMNRDEIYVEEGMFTPKILDKSKNIHRKQKIQNLLYNDAKRRQQHQKLSKSTHHLPPASIPPLNKNTNKLVSKKIISQLEEMVEEQEYISPIMAISIISELFHINLNPNKDQQTEELCHEVLVYLLKGEQKSSQSYVLKQKLQGFIKAIIGDQSEYIVLSKEDQQQIHEKMGYFYRERLAKQKKTKEPQIQVYAPKTLESSKKLAENYRQKKLEQIASFLTERDTEKMQTERVIRLEDLFILDQMRKEADLNQKRRLNSEKQLQHCSFRPSLERKHYVQSRPKCLSRTTRVKTQHQAGNSILQSFLQKNIIEDHSISTIKQASEKVAKKQRVFKQKSEFSQEKQIEENKERKKKITLKPKKQREIKDLQKNLLRMSVGRKIREYQNSLKERGYKSKENWKRSQQKLKKQIKDQDQILRGFRVSASLRNSLNPQKAPIRY